VNQNEFAALAVLRLDWAAPAGLNKLPQLHGNTSTMNRAKIIRPGKLEIEFAKMMRADPE
jgi:hypothetical protein